MKKIGICTHCAWTSYGSILQSWALKKILSSIGISSVIVSDDKNTFDNKEFVINKISVSSLVKYIYRLFHCPKICDKYKKILNFKDRRLDFLFYKSVDDLKCHLPNVDMFISGSDQVFHPDTCSPLFFLDFVPSSIVRASYAASMGVTDIKNDKNEEFKRLISNFDFLSVRENENAEIISKMTDKEVLVHVDPTFLIDDNCWRRLETPYPIREKYILLYAIYWDEKFNKSLKELEKKYGVKIISINSGVSKAYSSKKIFDAGIEEFLWLVDHAEAVITSSFHGAAISIIFRKKLSVVINPSAPSRLNSLLAKFCLETPSIDQIFSNPVDYSGVEDILIAEQKRSINYLKKVVSYDKHK